MSEKKPYAFFGWALLALCLLALPIGLIAKPPDKHEDAESESKSWSPLANKDRIQVLKLYGAIADDSGSGSFLQDSSSASGVRKKLHKALDDKHIKAILLRINSPGGTVGMSQEIYDEVTALRTKGKPVVVSMGDVAASGGYYIASAADRIFANPGTLTGSIGVIMHLMNWQETEKKIGIQPAVIKSGVFKDIGSADRPMSTEEKDLLQNIIMDSYDQFVTAVAQGRHMDKEAVKKLADGRVYSGRQAKQAKLVDDLGGYEDALAWLQTDCKKKYNLDKDLKVDDGSSSLQFFSNLLNSATQAPAPGAQVSSFLKGVLPASMDPQFNKVPLWMMQ